MHLRCMQTGAVISYILAIVNKQRKNTSVELCVSGGPDTLFQGISDQFLNYSLVGS